MHAPRHLRSPQPLGRRLAALGLFALQGAIAVSPLLEQRSEVRLAAHAEQNGTRHDNAHNEETCALCSARAQTSMPATVAGAMETLRGSIVASLDSYNAPTRRDSSPRHSRAPPTLPA